MDKRNIEDRVDIAELESIFGVRICISVDDKTGIYHIVVHKKPFYKHNMLTISEVDSMRDDDLKLAMKTFAEEVFNAYYQQIF